MELNLELASVALRLWPLYLLLGAVIAGGYFYDKRRRELAQKFISKEPFMRIVNKYVHFTLFGDVKPITTKQEKRDEDSQQIVTYPYFKQARFIYHLLILVSLAVLAAYAVGLINGVGYVFIAPVLLAALVVTRGRSIFVNRANLVNRMFQVADSEFKYGKQAAVTPWAYVKVRKWEGDLSPGETVVTVPAGWSADDPRLKDKFERHFKSTVTDENSWTYEWEGAKGTVTCKPVSHLPRNAPYPGSKDQAWNTIPLGEGSEGPVTWDVSSAPHLLVCGPTGTGKSVLQRNIFFHLVQHQDRWGFIGVDPKRVELKPYAKYTDTVLGIGTNLEDGVELVRFADNLMNERYEMMENMGVNNFMDLASPPKAILVMVDETFMFLSPGGIKSDEGKEMDALKAEAAVLLGNIARLGRAAGIHLLLATQRPDATVIKGELKNNLDARIACGRMDQTPSMMVLDSIGATLLPPIKGRGVLRQHSTEQQFQGYFAEQSWIDEWLAKNRPTSNQEIDVEMEEESPDLFESAEPEPVAAATEPEMDEESQPEGKKKRKGLLGKLNSLNEKAASRFQDEEDEKPAQKQKKQKPVPAENPAVAEEPEDTRPKPLSDLDEDDFDSEEFIAPPEPKNQRKKETVPASKNSGDDEWEDPFGGLLD